MGRQLSLVFLYAAVVMALMASLVTSAPTPSPALKARSPKPSPAKRSSPSGSAKRARGQLPMGKCAVYAPDAFVVRVQTDVGHVIGWLAENGKPEIITSKTQAGCYQLTEESGPSALTLLSTPYTLQIKSPASISDWSPTHSPGFGPATSSVQPNADGVQVQAQIWSTEDDDKLKATWRDATTGATTALKLIQVDDLDAPTFGAEFEGDAFGLEIFFFKEFS